MQWSSQRRGISKHQKHVHERLRSLRIQFRVDFDWTLNRELMFLLPLQESLSDELPSEATRGTGVQLEVVVSGSRSMSVRSGWPYWPKTIFGT